MAYAESALPSCNCQDLRIPAVVFGGLLLSFALCGAVDMGRPLQASFEEVKALNLENAIGPVEIDPYGIDCHRKSAKDPSVAFASLERMAGNCGKKSARSAHYQIQ